MTDNELCSVSVHSNNVFVGGLCTLKSVLQDMGECDNDLLPSLHMICIRIDKHLIGGKSREICSFQKKNNTLSMPWRATPDMQADAHVRCAIACFLVGLFCDSNAQRVSVLLSTDVAVDLITLPVMTLYITAIGQIVALLTPDTTVQKYMIRWMEQTICTLMLALGVAFLGGITSQDILLLIGVTATVPATVGLVQDILRINDIYNQHVFLILNILCANAVLTPFGVVARSIDMHQPPA